MRLLLSRCRRPAYIALLAATIASGAPAAAKPLYGPATPFSFERLDQRAQTLAAEPFKPTVIDDPAAYEAIDYDAHWKIKFREAATVEAGETAPLQFFHLGRYFREPVKISVVDHGTSREVLYDQDRYFSMPQDSPAHKISGDAGFAGFRIMRPDLKTDWISFLGGAYFRTDGSDTQYGLSARGLALDTGLSTPEEFPRFTEFYIAPGDDGSDAVIYALLDSPSVTGAYRMVAANDDGQILDITASLHFRKPVERVGIAPLTSMFWYSEANRINGRDWRPEVHDSDGLAIASGSGERIWRPLNNPDRVVTSSFFDDHIKGFGLLQRDRDFTHYQDDGVFYNRRPSVWIETVGDWGKGAVQLVEIPTDDEIYDNIVAYWLPADLPEAGTSMTYRYRLHWNRAEPYPTKLATTTATRIGPGGVPGQPRPAGLTKYVIDFAGAPLKGLTREDGVTPVVSVGNGAQIVDSSAYPIVSGTGWRMMFDIEVEPGVSTVDIRAYLEKDGEALTETWLGQLHPRQFHPELAEGRG
ncbi:glucan biosynthesis protein [Acuticoccus mangrovi]|uniref:Glucan biosynthesis protein D n=1 Tax=Acuticoccus mangrovi TaxID=2796142 RepID=A0A934IKX8_9HYPH|nr:glucan biosynthesis protein D [Acuticoccus mangrovi]MBJ3775697.1 glucan biosynthesis protein D [Acuticoccus mangrovi]